MIPFFIYAALGKYEITQAQWESVMGSNPSRNKGANQPVEQVSWYDVHSFIHALNEAAGDSLYRLPTEAEWEYACRGGTTSPWSFGADVSQLREYAWYHNNAYLVGLMYAQPVGTKLPNPWGLHDMHGNVWEWCQDWYGEDYSSSSPSTDPTGPGIGSYCVIRGGCYDSFAQVARSATRGRGYPYSAIWPSTGARLLRMR